MRFFRVTLLSLAFCLLGVSSALASIGVGVGVGKIQVDQNLRPGEVYELPSVPVLNTGDEVSEYEMTIEFHEGITELWPDRKWFTFSPKTFQLEPGKVQTVRVALSVPVKVRPGNYFAYLEAHPMRKSTSSGGATIGVAAASKLHFTVIPANFIAGLYYRVITLMSFYKPWSYIALGGITLIAVVSILRKYVSLNIGVSLKQ